MLGWWSALSSYYDLRGELTLWGWWGLVLVYVLCAGLAAWFVARWHARAAVWLASWYRCALLLNVAILCYAVL